MDTEIWRKKKEVGNRGTEPDTEKEEKERNGATIFIHRQTGRYSVQPLMQTLDEDVIMSL